MSQPPCTPDYRYIVVNGVLWRAARPDLPDKRRAELVKQLMDARRGVAAGQRAGDEAAVRQARDAVQAAKVALGERGPVWWDDGAPDWNRHKVENTPYADWWAGR